MKSIHVHPQRNVLRLSPKRITPYAFFLYFIRFSSEFSGRELWECFCYFFFIFVLVKFLVLFLLFLCSVLFSVIQPSNTSNNILFRCNLTVKASAEFAYSKTTEFVFLLFQATMKWAKSRKSGQFFMNTFSTSVEQFVDNKHDIYMSKFLNFK